MHFHVLSQQQSDAAIALGADKMNNPAIMYDHYYYPATLSRRQGITVS